MPEEIEGTSTAEATQESTAAVPEWCAGLPEEIRAAESLAKFDNSDNPLVALANGYLGAERAIGADKVVLPGREATDEQRREFYTKIGCPESVDGYQPPTENISEQFDPSLFESLREDFHRLGVTPQQAAGLARALDAKQAAQLEQMEASGVKQMEQWEQDLRVEYGDAYDQQTELARGVVNSFGGDALVELLDQTGLGSHPVMVKAFADIAKVMAEDEILGGGGAQSFARTPQQASDEWDALQLDQGYMAALTDSNSPGHRAALEKQTKLFQAMHPGKES